MDYCPHTPDDIKQMQSAIGIASIDELFADIPQKFRLKRMLDIPAALSEQQTIAAISDLARKNKLPQLTLTGAGAYHHFIPAVVGHIIGRAEFYTAYTPYQAEISQGILQAIYEYQTMIAHLTGTEIANASMYDGASAMAEAAVLCAKMSNRTKIIVARSVHPEYRQVVNTYSWANGYTVVEIPYASSGQVDLNALQKELDDQVAAVLVQSPNFFGVIEDIAPLADAAHQKGALLVAGFTDDLGYKELSNFFEKPLNFEKIKSGAKHFVAIHSDNDPFVSLKYGDIFREKLGAEVIIKHNMKHFSGTVDDEESCTSLPEVAKAIIKLSSQ